MMTVTVGILGPALVVVEGVPSGPGGSKVGRVLAALAIRSGERVSTERLIDDVWGDAAPPRARASLQMHIAKLRKLLAGTSVEIHTVADGYRLVAPPGAVDADEFTRLAGDARLARSEGRWKTAADRSARGLTLWRGDRIEMLDDVPSLAGEITNLLEQRRQTRLIHAEALLALGQSESAVRELEDDVAAEPFVERFWELLMLALYRCGRQADALAAYRRAATLLGEELGIEPGPALSRLEEQILLQDPSLLEVPEPTPFVPTLPVRTAPLIGRDQEVRRAVKRAAEERLLTIVGPGGVGKTTLALEVGRRLSDGCADGGLFVDLTAADHDDVVAVTAAEGLGLSPPGDPLEAVTDHLRSRSMVVVIDNCEHVLKGAAALVTAMAERCPDLLVVVTSRRRLDISGEVCLQLAPLGVPPVGVQPVELDRYPALRLFTDRARAVQPGLEVGPGDLGALSDICRRLDGLPLALELVASWANVLTIHDIRDRIGELAPLGSRRAPVEGGRHAGVDDAIDWSYRLLSDEERSAFDRLAVFRASFDLAGGAAVLEVDEDTALRALGSLVDASLLVTDLTGPSARYRMLETIHSFGTRRLAERADRDEVTERHRRFVIDAARNTADLDETVWFDQVQAMLPDLRIVLDWAGEYDAAIVVDLAERLRLFWTQRGLGLEIEPRLEEVVERVDSASAWYTLGVMRYARGAFDEARTAFESGLAAPCDERDRARITNALGVVALQRGDYETAAVRYREAEELFSTAGYRLGVAATRLNQGIADLNLGHYDRAGDHFETARAMFRDEGDVREEAHTLVRLAFTAELQGRPAVALERAHASLRIARSLGTSLALADSLQATADFEMGAGSTAAARSLLAEAVEMFLALRHLVGLQRAMITATAVAAADQQWTEAAEMGAYAAEMRNRLGIPVPAANRPAFEQISQAVATAVPLVRREALAERARLAEIEDMAARCLDVLSRSGEATG